MDDLVIRNVSLVDGIGRDGHRADVAIDRERITAVGQVGGSAWMRWTPKA